MLRNVGFAVGILMLCLATQAFAGPPVPVVEGEWWTIANSPDLGPLTTPTQQPVDFAIWQAADGTWQVWSCIRGTKEPGKTRLLHRWEGKSLEDLDWPAQGIAMQADPRLGETPGGLQAPHVVRIGDSFTMLYGDWEHICLATSSDGKTFRRAAIEEGRPALFTQEAGANTRDPMAIRIGDAWHVYYTAHAHNQGAVYCRTSPDLRTYSAAKTVAFGGRAQTGPYTAECPFVVAHDGAYYLFRTQKYGQEAITRIYRSDDPLDFGLNQDEGHYVGSLPVAAPEIFTHAGQTYIAALRGDLKGIQLAKLVWKAE